ncbi:hypothetical protein PV327_002410 [Microctonus hyperodae]|uniref:Uncharacterized protein n=1 Tax=Microctonus hyperodae TaxID=165561 RepID=A0AA39FFI9_MICHY|nr:hypothetical protein PV327_002410 [Microctonus hyperodae]
MLPTHHKKRNMVMDSMRLGGGRCPPLVVSILLLACFLLIFNWWSLSTENIELINQLDQLQDQLKITVDERDKFLTLKDSFEQQLKNSESEVGVLHVRLQKQNELKKHNDELTEDLAMCKSKLDSLTKLDVTKTATLEAQRLEKDGLRTELDTKREETNKLVLELNKTKDEMELLKQTCNKNNGKDLEKNNADKDTSNLADLGELEVIEKYVPENMKKNNAVVNNDAEPSPKSITPQSTNLDRVA